MKLNELTVGTQFHLKGEEDIIRTVTSILDTNIIYKWRSLDGLSTGESVAEITKSNLDDMVRHYELNGVKAEMTDLYPLSKLKEAYKIHYKLDESALGDYLLVDDRRTLGDDNTPSDNLVKFTLIEFNSRESKENSESYYTTVFFGYGFSALDEKNDYAELRHIWWGEDGNGYTYYPPTQSIIKALEILNKEYFKGDK